MSTCRIESTEIVCITPMFWCWPPRMEFITVSNPSRRLPAKLRRQAHSHASRATHARARRLRTEEYQRQKKIPGEESQTDEYRTTKEEQDQENINRPGRHDELILVDPSETSLPAPSILGSLVHEPLASFLQSLAPREHFLFNHCACDLYIALVQLQTSPADKKW